MKNTKTCGRCHFKGKTICLHGLSGREGKPDSSDPACAYHRDILETETCTKLNELRSFGSAYSDKTLLTLCKEIAIADMKQNQSGETE